MKLIPEQIRYLREEIQKLQKEIESYDQYYQERDKEGSTKQTCMAFCGDIITEHQITENHKTLRKYETLLTTSDYIRKPTTDVIGIGTKFTIKFDGEEITENYILVDALVGNHMVDEAITLESPLGKSIVGKKEGESFSYIVGSNNMKITGQVIAIEKDKKAYLSYIRESARVCDRKTDAIIDDSMINSESVDKDTIRKYHILQEIPNITKTEAPMITVSQKELLEIELERISNVIPNVPKEKAIVCHRIEKIKRMLNNCVIANPTGDIITTGTTFSIMLFADEGTITKRVELIDKAISDELENEYVEKISPFGLAVCGLKNQEEFIIRINQKYVSGVVYDISNNLEDLKTIDATGYQKSKKSLESI